MEVNLFSALSDPTRQKIVVELSQGRRSVTDLVNSLEMTQPTISKHLKVLKDNKIVSVRAEGQKRFYALNKNTLSKVQQWLAAVIEGRILEDGFEYVSHDPQLSVTENDWSPEAVVLSREDYSSEVGEDVSGIDEDGSNPADQIFKGAQRAAKGASDFITKLRKKNKE